MDCSCGRRALEPWTLVIPPGDKGILVSDCLAFQRIMRVEEIHISDPVIELHTVMIGQHLMYFSLITPGVWSIESEVHQEKGAGRTGYPGLQMRLDFRNPTNEPRTITFSVIGTVADSDYDLPEMPNPAGDPVPQRPPARLRRMRWAGYQAFEEIEPVPEPSAP